MRNQLQIGDASSTEIKPLIAVSMQGKNEIELLDFLISLEIKDADVIEWRVDNWQDLSKLTSDKISKVIDKSPKPMILTWRTSNEGGKLPLNIDEYRRIYLAAIHANVAAIDVEFWMIDLVSDILAAAKEAGVKVIVSRHDWSFPLNLSSRIEELNIASVDIIKYATFASDAFQAKQLLDVTKELSFKLDKPLITMAMGEAGQVTRLEGYLYGSQLTFAYVGEESAPGQSSLESIQMYFRK